MKKIAFDFDEKIKNYIYIYLGVSLVYIITQIYYIFGGGYDFEEIGSSFTGILYSVFVFAVILIVFVIYLLLMDATFTCVMRNEYMNFGTLGLLKVNYSSITSISFGRHIILGFGNKKAKIRVLNFEKNKDKYLELLNFLKEKTSLEYSVEEAMAQLSYINNFEFAEEGKALRLNGWFFIAFVFGIIYSALLGLYVPMLLLLCLFAFDWSLILLTLFVVGFFALALIATIFMGKHHKKTLSIFKGLLIFSCVAIIAVILLLIFAYFYTEQNIYIDYFSAILVYVASLSVYFVFALIIFRCLKVSKTLKHMFVYDKFQPVMKYDRSIDPGFKLFAKEPASIFGVFCWIIMPILYIVFIVAIIAASLAGGLF